MSEPREVSPFRMDKGQRSTAPTTQTDGDEVVETTDEARTIMPLMFTKPNEDVYLSDDPEERPIYSDFRAVPYPANADVSVPGEDEASPKGLSALASAVSSTESPTESPEPTAPLVSGDGTTEQNPGSPEPMTEDQAIQTAATSLDAVKDSGPDKESESSTPTGSSTPTTSPGSSEPPAETQPPEGGE